MSFSSVHPLPPQRVKQFVLLAGGKGTRLGVLTASTPKPLMEIGQDRVFLDLLIGNIVRQGFEEILILAGFHGDQILDRYHGRTIAGCQIRVAIESVPMGTAGALRWSRELLHPEFFLANGDTYFDICYRTTERTLRSVSGAQAAMALRHVDDASRYGSIDLANHRIVRFQEKRITTEPVPGLINGGVYLLSKSLVETFPDGEFSLETQVFPRLAEGMRMAGHVSNGYFVDIGLPTTLQQAREEIQAVIKRPAIFLDRDGVINIDHGYVHDWNNFDIIPGVAEAIKHFNESGWFVFVVTNQAGVAHGYYDESAIAKLHGQFQDWLANHGAHVDAFYYCPHHPSGKIENYRGVHFDRKPSPGMILRAMQDFSVDITRSFLVGDRETDLQAANAAKIGAHLFDGTDLLAFLKSCALLPK